MNTGVAAGLARNPIVGGALVLAVVGGFVWWKWGDQLKKTLNLFNPVSDQNAAYSGVNAVGSAVSGDEHWTLGGAIYDLMHPYDPNLPTKTNRLRANSDVEGRPSSVR